MTSERTETEDELLGDEMAVTGAVVSPTSGETPEPESETTTGLDEALLSIVRDPERRPETVGVKTTLAVQLCPGA